jgi:hypothetical protein
LRWNLVQFLVKPKLQFVKARFWLKFYSAFKVAQKFATRFAFSQK